MPDKPPLDSPEPPDPSDLPPAAQWMMAQAAAAQNEPPQRAKAELSFTSLAQRRERVLGGLRGNDKLTTGLGTAAAARRHPPGRCPARSRRGLRPTLRRAGA